MKDKLKSLRKILPDELLNLPRHIPAEELGGTLASFKLLARKQGRAKVARSDLHGATWEAASDKVLLPDEQARRTHLRVAPAPLSTQHLSPHAYASTRSQLVANLKTDAPAEAVDKLVMALRALPVQSTVNLFAAATVAAAALAAATVAAATVQRKQRGTPLSGQPQDPGAPSALLTHALHLPMRTHAHPRRAHGRER